MNNKENFNKSCIGLLTYHSAYNYGSALQAYATQEYLIKKFPEYNFEMINYRMQEQKDYYSLFRTKYGAKTCLRDLSQLSIYRKRKKRSDKFEKFISEFFNLTNEFSNPDQINEIWGKYSAIISGSDQIWNKHSCELHRSEWRFMNPYILKGYKGKKISYASSIGNLEDKEFDVISSDIQAFDCISMRELHSAKYVEEKIGRPVEHVVDPTFLLNCEEWIDKLKLKKSDDNYIFYYSLCRNYSQSLRTFKQLRFYAKKNKCKLKVITPYMYLFDRLYMGVENCAQYGPIEFLNCIYNAKEVVTDSFHGTALSINFNKSFYTIDITSGQDKRAAALIKMCGISDRLVPDAACLNQNRFDKIDYNYVNLQIETLRRNSMIFIDYSLRA